MFVHSIDHCHLRSSHRPSRAGERRNAACYALCHALCYALCDALCHALRSVLCCMLCLICHALRACILSIAGCMLGWVVWHVGVSWMGILMYVTFRVQFRLIETSVMGSTFFARPACRMG